MADPKDLRFTLRPVDECCRTGGARQHEPAVKAVDVRGFRLHEAAWPADDEDGQVPSLLADVTPFPGVVTGAVRPSYVLLNPGPVLTSAAVKAALGVDVTHRDSDFTELLAGLQDKLCRVFQADRSRYSVVLLTGSGTGAAEATLSTFVPHGKKVLVVQNGAFGERMQEIAAIHGIDAAPLRYGWGEAVRPSEVEARLMADPTLAAVAMVHHETSVGVLNPVRAVGEVAARQGRLFFLDCISSLGGEQLDVERDHVDVAIACGNKCLHSVSGLSFACVKRSVWKLIEGERPRSVYLDLRRYHHYQETLGQTPFTPAVAAAFALDQALRELLAQGLDGRIEHYRILSAAMRRGLRALGLNIENGHERGSHTLSCVTMPAGVAFDDLYVELKSAGYIVYNGKGAQAGRMFQIANMGVLTVDHVRDFLPVLGEVLGRLRTRSEGAAPTHARPEVNHV